MTKKAWTTPGGSILNAVLFACSSLRPSDAKPAVARVRKCFGRLVGNPHLTVIQLASQNPDALAERGYVRIGGYTTLIQWKAPES